MKNSSKLTEAARSKEVKAPQVSDSRLPHPLEGLSRRPFRFAARKGQANHRIGDRPLRPGKPAGTSITSLEIGHGAIIDKPSVVEDAKRIGDILKLPKRVARDET